MLPGMFLVNMVRKKRIKPEQDAILSDKDKAFIEGRQINTFKGRGVLALEHIESSTFVVEDRGILSQSKHVEDVEGNYLFDFTWNGTRNCIDATKVDCSLGRLLNDDHRNPNCKVKTIIVDGRPHLCLFSIRDIFPDEEVTYNYGDSSWPWRLRELCDEPSVTVTECRVNPSSSVSEKELGDETSVTVTECRVNPSSSVSEKRPNRGTLKRPWSPNEVNAVMKHYSIFQRDTLQQKPIVSSARLQRTLL
ncbi:histone-lysine N-methyltransferase set-1-like isoform X3 [Chanodichthys erythropterus]|uniref:histone-lysine N-methyltransferase set-1-like isoform X3 n=1 Tax=Chanodichthys erythropterus TaxID=933992 RepID=UPI00351E4B7E